MKCAVSAREICGMPDIAQALAGRDTSCVSGPSLSCAGCTMVQSSSLSRISLIADRLVGVDAAQQRAEEDLRHQRRVRDTMSPTPSADVNISRRTPAACIAAMMPGTLRSIRCSDLND